ncbi:protein HESO1-like [Lolium rigidum]|uniref:protein HESO1-like n=1 Tax=Lolium rigidum TaxID=89674 RepID=UPI001F5DB11F|nr:protein HESO1-like [Lolium rigidum]
MATAAVSPPAPKPEPPAPSDDLPRSREAVSWDPQALCKHAETCELQSEAFFIDPALLPTLEGQLLELYGILRPKPADYEQRRTMIDVFNKIAKDIFGETNGFPVVEAFGSFTMDLFTAKSDLDLSVNFSNDMDGQFARFDQISVIRKLTKVLRKHQSNGRCYGVLPIISAKVPVLKVTDKGTGVECDISVENKDGMSRSEIFKLVSSIDERFQILCFLMKFWAKTHNVNCPKDGTMSSMAIISLVAFHLQTRHPPILPAFSGLLKDGTDIASIQKNVVLLGGFGSRNKESVAELFVSLMSKLLAVEGLWEHGLCASNFDGCWISKTSGRGVGSLTVEDFLDRSQNFARAVGKAELRTIHGCLRKTVSKLSDFFKGNIDAPTLKIRIFGALNQEDVPARQPSLKPGKSKRKMDSQHEKQKKKGKHTAQPGRSATGATPKLPTPAVVFPLPGHYAPILPTPTVLMPLPPVHQVGSSQPIYQFGPLPQQHPFPPSRFAYGSPQAHLHPGAHMIGQPQGSFIHPNPGARRHQHSPHMLASLLNHGAINGSSHPYGFNGAPQIQYDGNGRLLPYGINPNYYRGA